MEAINVLPLLLISLLLTFLVTEATDIITANQTLKDGDTIVSKGGSFELGFFSPGGSRNRYLGIWYKKVSLQTVVWVANRDSPLYDLSGTLKVSENGSLRLFSGRDYIIWSSSSLEKPVVRNPIVQILDTGNLVVRNSGYDQDYIWQSLDYPGDTFLPGMKYGIDFSTGINRFLTSWISPDNPSTGNYTNKMDPSGVPQFFLKKNSVDVFRAGPWNGLRFTGMPHLKPNPIYRYEFVFTEEEVYYTYKLENPSVITRMQLNPNGALQRYTWVDSLQSWNFYLSAQMDSCDQYMLCGSYGSCNINESPACRCLKGFVPKSPEAYYAGDWSGGCVREVKMGCGKGEEDFLKISKLKLPDTRGSWYDMRMDLSECKRVCLRNCSCSAYSPFDIRDRGSGCILWFGDLIDIREYNENGQDLYVRLATSEIAKYKNYGVKGKMRIMLIIVFSTVLLLICLCICLTFCNMRKRKKLATIETSHGDLDRVSSRKQEEEDAELPFLDLEAIAEATSGFSDENKLGQGGFGPVYKGTLSCGQEIAVKRLSRTSRQGIEEFKNEIKLIAKLQHRNLVKILGYCVEEDERMLIYDGYMSPEYQIDGFFSLKSDVFSFGVLVLEIVSGRRNRGFCNQEHKLNLLGHLIDEALKESCTDVSEVLRAIHIGLLCVQQDPQDRPTMSVVVLMLSSDMLLLDPKEPGFYNERNLLYSDTTSINLEIPSKNFQTMSVIDPR
ncbi:hypothetical protein HID58_041953 [Brassica napus]|uniref:Receptor-like serine/threonine-protein kinase n=1 Tax=Brassica napus TaxID=3708 RepID=A0ABQ8BCB0_BRANA|nr:hypothetical protein HID58_041953 [Brassica napus]